MVVGSVDIAVVDIVVGRELVGIGIVVVVVVDIAVNRLVAGVVVEVVEVVVDWVVVVEVDRFGKGVDRVVVDRVVGVRVERGY